MDRNKQIGNYKHIIRGGCNMYKVIVLDSSPKADVMAKQIENKINEMTNDGYELVTLTETTTARAIIVFKK